MRLLGFEVSVRKSAGTLTPVMSGVRNLLNFVRESFPGAWQQNVTLESTDNILAFSAVYACISLIAGDIAKLRPRLMEDKGTHPEEVRSTTVPFLRVLKKPNGYQTRVQFLNNWISCKLIHGNVYAYKERESLRGMVKALHILDPRRVTPLVAENGDVYYQINSDQLAGLTEPITVPASEIIHDRMICLFHPLIGVSPIYACSLTTTQGIKIQQNSSVFFQNMSRPSGQLTSTNVIDDPTAERLKREFEANFSAGNIGRLLVTGSGLKYEPMGTIPARDAQLIDQLRWTVEDIARCFHVPLHKIASAQNPTYNNIGALNQDYYSQTLQELIEAMEVLLDEGLELPPGYSVELDLKGLLRMDPAARAEANEKAIKAGYLKPNEARAEEGHAPVEGGDTPYMQQQNYALAALAKRDASADPFRSNAPAPTPAPAPAPALPAPQPDDSAKAIAAAIIKKFREETPCLT